jgi:hypothetical protein
MKDIVNRTKRAARGLALADNLVVISIIGILIRLLLRAVQDTLRLREQANEEAWTTSIGPASVFIESLNQLPGGVGSVLSYPSDGSGEPRSRMSTTWRTSKWTNPQTLHFLPMTARYGGSTKRFGSGLCC